MTDQQAPSKQAQATEYVVLRRATESTSQTEGTRQLWEEAGKATGATATAAIAQIAKGADRATFVAVPARSWKPKTPHVETVERIRWS